MVTDPIPFMANIALVAHADGTLSPAELGQLEAIRKEMKFKKSDYNSAVRLVQDGDTIQGIQADYSWFICRSSQESGTYVACRICR